MTEPAGAAGPARIVLATRNPGKLAELRRILAAAGVSAAVTDLEDVPGMPEVAETGRSFTENALLKARAVAAFIGLPAVADDSGLCVDALNGMPGVLSARWSGSHGDDEANLRLLLAQLADVPAGDRGARFVCVAALVLPSGRADPRAARQQWFRVRPHLRAGRLRAHHRADERGREGQDQPPWEGPAGAGTGHRGSARGLAPGRMGLAVGGDGGPASPPGTVVAVWLSVRLKGARVSEHKLAPGDKAPDFTLPDADGKPVSLSSLRGQQVIVYFYPAAMTPGCTTEACDFRDNLSSLAAAGVTVLGISPDGPAKLAKFRERDHLTFPLLSDPDHQVEKAYGAYGEKKLYGKTTMGVIRSTFVIDPSGVVSRAYYNVKATGHVARLRKELGL
jgi:peroxiredoxin Q/BCP